MKNSRNLVLVVAVAWLALPAVVFGQRVSCDECTHVASVYLGEGGVIAQADDADKVTWIATCSGVTRVGELEANDDGVVAGLWAGDLACMAEAGGTFEIGPVLDGGWFWVTDGMNSAVGGLVAMDVLAHHNGPVEIADAGEGVLRVPGRGAVFLKEVNTGRVGILPDLLPELPEEPPEVCGPRQAKTRPYAYDEQAVENCMLGTGRTKIRLLGPGRFGSQVPVTNGMVYRPKSGTITVRADLWVDETGSFTTVAPPDEGSADTVVANYVKSVQKGWPGKTATSSSRGKEENWLVATFSLSVEASVGRPTPVSGTVAGVTVVNTGSASTAPSRPDNEGGPPPIGQAVFTVGKDERYCSEDENHAALVYIAATPAARASDPTVFSATANQIHPPVATGEDAGLGKADDLKGYAAVTQLRIVCPPTSANMGQELVPENLFPTDR